MTQKAIVYRSIKQLLNENYKLLNRQRQQKIELSKQRHKAQKHEGFNQIGESNLGEYVDRLIAKAIVDIAKSYRVGSIFLPELKNIREILHSEVQAKAEIKITGYKEAQKKYMKEYRKNLHQWSYSRLIESISQLANQERISVEFIKQSNDGTQQEKAKRIAIDGYNSRS